VCEEGIHQTVEVAALTKDGSKASLVASSSPVDGQKEARERARRGNPRAARYLPF
jgi:hypothetical protein